MIEESHVVRYLGRCTRNTRTHIHSGYILHSLCVALAGSLQEHGVFTGSNATHHVRWPYLFVLNPNLVCLVSQQRTETLIRRQHHFFDGDATQ